VPPEVPLTPQFLRTRWKLYRGSAAGGAEYQLLAAALGGADVPPEERELVFPNGRRLTLLSSCSPIRDAQGRITGAVAAMVDMTEQKSLQVELDRRRREAEESSVRKTRFLAAVSHDIRTPANAISLLAELLQRSSNTPGMLEEIPEIARDLKSSALSLVHLVSDVLDVTRFDTGRVDLIESEFGIGDLLTEECRQFIQTARDKGLLFSCETPPRPIQVRADRVKLARVFSNVVANAVKFTETGGVTVEALQSASGGIEIRCADTGPGIEPEYADRIFDEYFQLRNPNRDASRGSGLGLAISRRLIQAMGGDITVQSALGKGSTFTIVLPPAAVVGS
jgi:signal transduction histidine kinase